MPSATTDKDFRKYLQLKMGQGWTVVAGSKHAKLVSPCGRKYPIPGSPSDQRALRNFRQRVEKLK